MHRRKFIKQSLILGGGLLALPVFSSAKTNSKFKGTTIIIGAGAAGLYAGKRLQESNHSVQILEASAGIGGRLKKLEGFMDYPIDLGAQWIHGQHALTKKLAEDKGITPVKEEFKFRHVWYKEKMKPRVPLRFSEFYLSLHMGKSKKFPDISLKDYAMQEGHESTLNLVEAIASETGTSANRLSAHYYVKELKNWDSGNKDYYLENTYFDLINEYWAKPLKPHIQLNTVVTRIDYSQSKIKVFDKNGKSYEADKVIIAVPITILQKGMIEFHPKLPTLQTEAFNKIKMDAGIKLYLKFKQRFFEGSIMGTSKVPYYIDIDKNKTHKDQVLISLIMGEQAEYISSIGELQATEEILEELTTLFGPVVRENFNGAYFQNWTNEPFIQGAYSYQGIGVGDARTIASRPVNQQLFFAGEAFNLNGNYQTVHGAAETGLEAVQAILSQK